MPKKKDVCQVHYFLKKKLEEIRWFLKQDRGLWQTVLLGAIFLWGINSGCQPKRATERTPYGIQTVGQRKANKLLLHKDEKTIWKLVRSHDPYNGGVTTLAEPSNPYTIELSNDGSFREQQGTILNQGKWRIEKKTNRLALIYTSEGNKAIPEQAQKINLSFQIRKHTQDSLCIAIQGRHGFVEKYYYKESGK